MGLLKSMWNGIIGKRYNLILQYPDENKDLYFRNQETLLLHLYDLLLKYKKGELAKPNTIYVTDFMSVFFALNINKTSDIGKIFIEAKRNGINYW